jgi:hypothetical protein
MIIRKPVAVALLTTALIAGALVLAITMNSGKE